MSLPRLVKIFCSASVLPGRAIAPRGMERVSGLCIAVLTAPVSAGIARV